MIISGKTIFITARKISALQLSSGQTVLAKANKNEDKSCKIVLLELILNYNLACSDVNN
jgi:hypothetical protein